MNGLTGTGSAKSRYQDLLPYQLHSESDRELMSSTRNCLIKLIRENKLPQWAKGLAIAHESVRRATDGS